MLLVSRTHDNINVKKWLENNLAALENGSFRRNTYLSKLSPVKTKVESGKFYRNFRRLYRRPASSFPSIPIGRRAKVGHHGFDIEDRENGFCNFEFFK
jgi:hypothetical protein